MQFSLAQAVALTCYGNYYLLHRAQEPSFPLGSRTWFCDHVTFVTLENRLFRRPCEVEVAESPVAWFQLLRSRHALGLRLSLAPRSHPEFPVGRCAKFSRGLPLEMLEVQWPSGTSEFWIEREDRPAVNRDLSRVTYGRLFQAETRPSTPVNLTEAARELEDSLRAARAYSITEGLDQYTQTFDRAIKALVFQPRNHSRSQEPLAPNGFLSEQAAALLNACQQSWVFGGMGAWNDMVSADVYDQVSGRLYEAVASAVVEVAASTFPQSV